MRIAYLCADRGIEVLGRNGSATHVREFVCALVERGHEVTVFAAVAGGDPAAVPFPIVELRGDPVLEDLRLRIAKQHRERPGDPSPLASAVYGLLLNQSVLARLEAAAADADLVYERCSLWSLAGLQFARARRVPYVLEVNAPLVAQQEQYRRLVLPEAARAVEAMLFEQADRVLVTTDALTDYVRGAGATGRKVRVLPCGVPKRMIVGAGARRYHRHSPFVMGFLGSLKPWHGIDVLMEAFVQLRRRSGDYRLLVVGDGPLRPYVEDVARRAGVLDAIELAGAVDHEDVPAYLARMDVGLAPYPPLERFYFSPLKVWEYAAAGVPIVASRSGEIERMLPHKRAALLHDPGSVRKVVQHVERLREDPALAERLARRARRAARERTWDRIAARFEDIAEKLLAERGARG